jgi:hypothetical protein
MGDTYVNGQAVTDVNGKTGRIDRRVTTGQVVEGRPSYPHVYDVTYDDGSQDRRMHYHLRPA